MQPQKTLVKQTITALQEVCTTFKNVRFASSLGAEDMVLSHIIKENRLPIEIFTLDTGRLNPETYDLMASAAEFNITVFFPQASNVEAFTKQYGVNGIYDSLEARKACCAARKIEPLKRALVGAGAWVTGLRREQSEARQGLTALAMDTATGLNKCNPLIDWLGADIWSYVNEHQVPVNALHAQGYPSIGCAACTRAVAAGEHPRAGRWWWEEDDKKECGLHLDDSGKLVRTYKSPSKEIAL
jgi:phosphoadenosine phosphosulfate reductase